MPARFRDISYRKNWAKGHFLFELFSSEPRAKLLFVFIKNSRSGVVGRVMRKSGFKDVGGIVA
jgi:hypothetical protein